MYSHSLFEAWTCTVALTFYYMHMFNDKPAIDLHNLLCVQKYCVFYYYRKYALNSCWCIFLSSVNSWYNYDACV